RVSGYDLRQPGYGDRHQRSPRAPRHEKAPAARPRANHGGELLVSWRKSLLIAVCAPLAACSATRLAYDNADTAVRFMAASYLELNADQTEDLRQRIVEFHRWHRQNELPAAAALMRSASERASRGITPEDVAWGLANVRARYRSVAAKAAEDAAPLLATLSPGQVAALESRFAENNQKYAREFLAAD